MVKDTTIIRLKGLNGLQTILSYFAKHTNNVNIKIDPKEELPQTVLELPEGDKDTIDESVQQGGCICYVNSHKKSVKMWVTMYDIVLKDVLPKSTTCKCWYHRGTIKTSPLGCPIRTSHWSKDDTIVKKKKRFETIGMFCSFPCIKSYIIDNINNVKYKNSLNLLSDMYVSFFGRYRDIPKALSWKRQEEYGGYMSTIDYTKAIGKVLSNMTVNTADTSDIISSMKPIGECIVEE